ncbi:unnamed protein product [Caenorhabditis brenneri]
MEYQCKLCNSFVVKSSVIAHAITHGNFVLFECGYCSKTFSGGYIGVVRKHILNQHKMPGEPLNYDNIKDNRKKLEKQIDEMRKRCFPTE